jgi:Hemerythrin HHE cation binding domain
VAKAKRESSNGRGATGASDAIAILKSDHRQVEDWFEQFEKSRAASRKRNLAARICTALKVHATIEEEIFYPAFLEATQEEDLHHEAVIEHDGARKLIAEIEATDADDEYFGARVSVLSEMIKHHVHEEEMKDGLFAKARQSEMDLDALGKQLASRKAELMKRMPDVKARPARRAESAGIGGRG